jgi:hypothetical protein
MLLQEFISEDFLYSIVESRADYLANVFGEKLLSALNNDPSVVNKEIFENNPLKIIEELSKADPTGNRQKSLQFIVRTYAAGQYKMEDLNVLKESLEQFFRYLPKIENKDLNSYPNVRDVYKVVMDLEQQDTPVPVTGREQKRLAKSEQVDVIIDTPNYKVLQPHTYEANCLYGAGTKWCTTAKEDQKTFYTYQKDGPLYIILAKEGGKTRKYQLHYESDQFMNELDEPVDDDMAEVNFLSQFPGHTEFLNYLIRKHYGKYFK